MPPVKRASTHHARELVMEHRAHQAPEVTHRDGYEGRIPTTTDGITQTRRRAAMWLAYKHRPERTP